MMPPGFFVLSVEVAEGERFAIVRPEDAFNPGPAGNSSPDWSSEVERWVRSLDLLTESVLLLRLEALGIAEDAAAAQISKARRVREMNKDASWERVSSIGYRNIDGQLVVAKTVQTGSDPAQRVFLLRCTVCGYEYGTLGCEIPHRCCPDCQDGEPGLPIPWDE